MRGMIQSKIHGCFALSDGTTVHLNDYRSHITTFELPVGHIAWCDSGLRRDEEALLTSILVVPEKKPTISHDYGVLHFEYNGRTRFVAPVASLMNRYHGLTQLSQLTARHRALIDPTVGLADWLEDGVFAGPLHEPILMRENLSFRFTHKPPTTITTMPSTFTIELQALVKSLDPEPFRFKVTP